MAKHHVALLMLIVLGGSLFAPASSPLPRKSPDFIIAEPSGRTTSLQSLKGKVVVLEFFFVQSSHCTRIAQMLNRLNTEMKPRGFQALGVVFDPPNSSASYGRLIGPVVDYFKINYPVGFSSKAGIDNFLGRLPKEVLNIPQIVVIDRAGMIRAASGVPGSDTSLEDENGLHNLVDKLLKENLP